MDGHSIMVGISTALSVVVAIVGGLAWALYSSHRSEMEDLRQTAMADRSRHDAEMRRLYERVEAMETGIHARLDTLAEALRADALDDRDRYVTRRECDRRHQAGPPA